MTIFFPLHCVKSVSRLSFFWFVFSCIRTRKNSVSGHFHKMFSVQGCKDSYKEWVQRGCRPLLLQPRNLSHRAHHKIFRTSHGSVKKISFNLFRSNVSICFSVPQHFVANAAETVQGSFWAEHFWGTAYCIAFVKFVTVSAILSVAII